MFRVAVDDMAGDSDDECRIMYRRCSMEHGPRMAGELSVFFLLYVIGWAASVFFFLSPRQACALQSPKQCDDPRACRLANSVSAYEAVRATQ